MELIRTVDVEEKRLKRNASIGLFFLSPITAELLTGSTPPLIFFNPFVFIILTLFYGSAAVLFRELTVRWNKSFGALFLLGASFGVLMEGIAVKSFFDLNWPDLGILGIYGRWLGVNWVWAVDLTIYHAIMSIVIPVALIELLYPAIRKQILLSQRWMYLLSSILALDVLFNAFVLTHYYFPPPLYYLAVVLFMFLLIYLAKKVPEKYDFHGTQHLPSTKKLWLIGALWALLNWFIFFVIPYTGIFPLVTIVLGLALFIFLFRYLQKFDWSSEIHQLSILSGVLAFPIVLAFLQELFGLNPDGAFGMTAVGIGYIVFLLYLREKIGTRSKGHV